MVGGAGATVVTFDPGTYHLATTFPFDAPDDTLVVSVSAGVASFTLSGAESATFSVENDVAPSGFIHYTADDPYYTGAAILSASWDTSTEPYLIFFADNDAGGVAASSDTYGDPPLAFSTDESNSGIGQVFTLGASVPEPGAWAMILLGVAGVGAVLRGRPRNASASILSGTT